MIDGSRTRRFSPTEVVESLRHALLPYDQRAMFFFLLRQQHKFFRKGVAPFGTYFEFGVGAGDSLLAMLLGLRDFCRSTGYRSRDFRVVVFDTFRGLPPKNSWRDASREWKEGMFASSVEDIRRRLRSRGVEKIPGSLRFVEGPFEKTLTPELRAELVPGPMARPAVVTVDVDYYSSTKTVLEWLRPELPSGAQLYFDDFWSFHGSPQHGQIAALEEFNAAGDGYLRNNPTIGPGGLSSNLFSFSRKEFEYQ